MSRVAPEQVLEDLADLLRNFPGREYSDQIHRETLFFADMGFRSIDAVVLGEMLEERFAKGLPFQELLTQAAQSGAQDISVGQIVDFLTRHLNAAAQE